MTRELPVWTGALPAHEAMAISRAGLDRTLEQDAALTVTEITTEATVLGAFQRPCDGPLDLPQARRISGGPYVRVGPGTLHVLLELAEPGALVPCDAKRLVNRYVRPLLRALTKNGALAHYFGRDWLSVAHSPAGQVGFGHDSGSGRAVFEAFVAVTAPFAPSGRPSFRGKEPGTLATLTGKTFDMAKLAGEIARAYAAASDRVVLARERPSGARARARAPEEALESLPWSASAEEVIGNVSAGRGANGPLAFGGDLLASRDAVTRLAAAVDALPLGASQDDVGALVDRELSPEQAPRVALEGVRDLTRIRDVLFRAR